jgi:hypothetical protein
MPLPVLACVPCNAADACSQALFRLSVGGMLHSSDCNKCVSLPPGV